MLLGLFLMIKSQIEFFKKLTKIQMSQVNPEGNRWMKCLFLVLFLILHIYFLQLSSSLHVDNKRGRIVGSLSVIYQCFPHPPSSSLTVWTVSCSVHGFGSGGGVTGSVISESSSGGRLESWLTGMRTVGHLGGKAEAVGESRGSNAGGWKGKDWSRTTIS